MKDYVAALISQAINATHARNLVREYLQVRILACFQRSGAFTHLAFLGGTALRILYSSQRFSEDLDFALVDAHKPHDFRAMLKMIRATLAPEGYAIELKVNDQKTVQSAFIKFPGLLYEIGLSPHTSETLSIKLEIDTNPPSGATLETTLVRRFIMLQIQHHDKSSLFAGKLHALLQRPYTKGRDLYDLMWYLSETGFTLPNFSMLNNALKQTGWQGVPLTPDNWRSTLVEHLQTLNWIDVRRDVAPFLISTSDLALLNIENLSQLLMR